ncbi:MAG: carboxypeptidase regulatory-like domain-containing protein, partial [Bryobacteraceae bacterium]|nr:carboxypeptidase regulatory-like domain-containing protein [Bryobacteraceae bacterium]
MKIVTIGLFLVFRAAAYGQESASLSGGVIDAELSLVGEAKVTLSDLKRDTKLQTVTNNNGIYVFEGLQPGEFLLEVEKDGFKKLRVERLRLASRDRVSLTLKLEAAGEGSTAVTLSGDVEAVSVDLSSGLALDREYVENLPVNGRNIQTLLLFMPGVVNPAGGIGGVDDLNVNGLRASTNYYMVDGVNANRGA